MKRFALIIMSIVSVLGISATAAPAGAHGFGHGHGGTGNRTSFGLITHTGTCSAMSGNTVIAGAYAVKSTRHTASDGMVGTDISGGVIVSGLAPNTTFGVWVSEAAGIDSFGNVTGCVSYEEALLTTDANGFGYVTFAGVIDANYSRAQIALCGNDDFCLNTGEGFSTNWFRV